MKAYELISLIREPLQLMNSKNINASSVEYLDMFNEYIKMRDEGMKKTYIVVCLCEKYKIGRTKFFELISSFESEI